MAIQLSCQSPETLGAVIEALRKWQRDDAPIQLHPGDLGWSWRYGAAVLATGLRTWSRSGTIIAVGILDSTDMVRLTMAPDVWREEELAHRVAADLADPAVGILPGGRAAVEVPDGTRLKELLSGGVWRAGESWTPLRLDLSRSPDEPNLRVELVESDEQIAACTAVHRSAWVSDRFDHQKWRTMAAGLPFSDGRCLLGRDDAGMAVATVTIWSAGAGRPALIEPLGVHADYRRRGYGAAICLAAGRHLHAMGSSSVMVCTPHLAPQRGRHLPGGRLRTRVTPPRPCPPHLNCLGRVQLNHALIASDHRELLRYSAPCWRHRERSFEGTVDRRASRPMKAIARR